MSKRDNNRLWKTAGKQQENISEIMHNTFKAKTHKEQR